MTQASLRDVTLETLANYRQVAEHTIEAYRAGGHRLLEVMNRNVERAASRGAERVAPKLAAALRRAGDQMADAAAKGIDAVSEQTGRVVEFSSAGVSAQVARVADLVEGIENRYIATGLQAAARVSLTGAQAALTLSEKLVAGADKLSTVIEGSAATRAKAAAGRAKRTVATRGRAAARSVRRVAAPAQAEVKAQAKAVARRVKAAHARATA